MSNHRRQKSGKSNHTGRSDVSGDDVTSRLAESSPVNDDADATMTLTYGPTPGQFASAFEGSHYQQVHGFTPPRTDNNLDVLSFNPSQGGPGAEFAIIARTVQDLRQFPAATFAISFGDQRVPAVMHQMGSANGYFQYAFGTHIPNSDASSWNITVPVSLHFEDSVFGAFASTGIGYFRYSTHFEPGDQQAEVQLQDGVKPGMGSLQLRGPREESYPNAPPRPRLDIPSGDAHTESASESDSPVANRPKSAALSSQRSGRRSFQSPPPPTPNAPKLVRTSTMRQSPTAHSLETFNPYAIYPNNKANLNLNGDLDSMAAGWTEEETRTSRRLVQFDRHQDGSTIHASFAPVKLQERDPNGICISCIWWKEKGEAFVTSVDTIYLLESLVAVRFTVEEKNRIRRNLEGFHPLTVSKSKSDSEDFFSIIMGFPDPKPRNIEKDVKVFPWRSLASALKKIIGKYSASYSSTAGLYPGTSTGATASPVSGTPLDLSRSSSFSQALQSRSPQVVPSQSSSGEANVHGLYQLHSGESSGSGTGADYSPWMAQGEPYSSQAQVFPARAQGSSGPRQPPFVPSQMQQVSWQSGATFYDPSSTSQAFSPHSPSVGQTAFDFSYDQEHDPSSSGRE